MVVSCPGNQYITVARCARVELCYIAPDHFFLSFILLLFFNTCTQTYLLLLREEIETCANDYQNFTFEINNAQEIEEVVFSDTTYFTILDGMTVYETLL